MTNTVTNQKSQTSYKAQKIISNVIIYAFLIFLLLLSIVPFYLVVVNAAKSIKRTSRRLRSFLNSTQMSLSNAFTPCYFLEVVF